MPNVVQNIEHVRRASAPRRCRCPWPHRARHCRWCSIWQYGDRGGAGIYDDSCRRLVPGSVEDAVAYRSDPTVVNTALRLVPGRAPITAIRGGDRDKRGDQTVFDRRRTIHSRRSTNSISVTNIQATHSCSSPGSRPSPHSLGISPVNQKRQPLCSVSKSDKVYYNHSLSNAERSARPRYYPPPVGWTSARRLVLVSDATEWRHLGQRRSTAPGQGGDQAWRNQGRRPRPSRPLSVRRWTTPRWGRSIGGCWRWCRRASSST